MKKTLAVLVSLLALTPLAAVAQQVYAGNGVNYGNGNIVVETSGTGAPSSSCTGLARYTQTDAAAGANTWVCISGTMVQQVTTGTPAATGQVGKSFMGPVANDRGYSIVTLNSTVTAGTSRDVFIPAFATTGIALVFTNASGNNETAGPPMTVTAAIEYPEGTLHQLYFRGVVTGVLDPGGVLVSDPCWGCNIPANTAAWKRVYFHRTSGSVAIPSQFSAGSGAEQGSSVFSPNTTTAAGGYWSQTETVKERSFSDGAMASGSAVLTSASLANFGFYDANQNITCSGIGASGATVTTTISTYTSATSVTLAVANASGGAVSGATCSITARDATMTLSPVLPNISSATFTSTAVLGVAAASAPTTWSLNSMSIIQGTGATYILGSWPFQALNPAGVTAGTGTRTYSPIPTVQMSMGGDNIVNVLNLHSTRYWPLNRVKYTLINDGTNDMGGSVASIEANILKEAGEAQIVGARAVDFTIIPRNTLGDGGLDYAGQSPNGTLQFSTRNSLNSWKRDGEPIDSTTGAAVAVGTSSASSCRAPYYNQTTLTAGGGACSTVTHPVYAVVEASYAVETDSSGNLGNPANYWYVDPTNKAMSGCSITVSTATLTCTTGTFVTGDQGKAITVSGAGTSGAFLNTTITSTGFISSTQVTLTANATTGVASGGTAIVAGTCGSYTIDGTHPSACGHAKIGAFVAPTLALSFFK